MNIENLYTKVAILKSELWWKYPIRKKRNIKEDLQSIFSDIVNIKKQEANHKEKFDDKIKLTNTCPLEVKKIFNFIDSNELYEYIDPDDMLEILDNSIFSLINKTEAENYLNFFENYIFRYDHFTFEQDYIKGYFRSSFIRMRDNTVEYLRNKFDIKDNRVYPHFDSHLPASPPSEAYKKVANSNLDIKPTGRDYWLLFR